MTVDTLFGPETITKKTRAIRFKQIKAVYETLTIREEITNYISPHERYTSPVQVYETFKFLRNETREVFLAIHLDIKNRIICIDMISQGSAFQSIVHPVEVFAPAMLSKACALIILHNHPSRDPTPSREDIEITRRLKEAGELLGIKVLDHIIIGETFISFVERGIM